MILLYIALLLCTVYYWVQRKHLRHLPAPGLYLPLIGHYKVLQDIQDPVNHVWRLYKEFNRNGMMLTSVLGLNNLFVGDFNAIKFLYNHPSVQNRVNEDWATDMIAHKIIADRGISKGAPKGVIMSQGQTWAEQRRFTLRTLRDFGFGKSSMEETIQEEVRSFISYLKEYTQTPVDLNGRFNLPILNVLWKVLVGERFEYDDPKLLDILKRMTEWLKRIASPSAIFSLTFPWIFKIFPKLFQRDEELKVHQDMRRLMEEKIQEHQETLDPSMPRDFIDTVLVEIENTTDKNSSFYGSAGMENLVNTLFDLFLAGAETTSTTLMWAVLYMVREQDVQRRVQEELDSVVGQARLPSVEDRANLPYTEAVIREIQRCGNIIPNGVHHIATEPVEVNGITVPANTWISPLMVEILKGDHWEEGMKFRPERFLDEEGRLKRDEHLIPFSIGKRQCLGETLARVELFLFFTGIVHQFSMLPVDGRLPEEKYTPGLTILPAAFNLILKQRF